MLSKLNELVNLINKLGKVDKFASLEAHAVSVEDQINKHHEHLLI